MKTYKQFAIILMLSSVFAEANTLQFSSESYLYADNSGLTVNVDVNAFDHRSWTYDPNMGFQTNFTLKMPLRTQYVKDGWETYSASMLSVQSSLLLKTGFKRVPYQGRVDDAYYQKTAPFFFALPALGGFIARQFAWNTFKRHALIGGTVASAAFCSDLLLSGITCAADGFTRFVSYSTVMNSTQLGLVDIPVPDDVSSRPAFLMSVFPKTYYYASFNRNYTLTHCNPSSAADGCTYVSDAGSSLRFGASFTRVQQSTITQDVSDSELMPFFDSIAQAMPSEVINEPTGGKNVRDVAIIGGSLGDGFSVYSSPWTHPNKGTTYQDTVTVGGATNSGTQVNSSTNTQVLSGSQVQSGKSSTTNTTTVISTPRPDVTDAPIAVPNSPSLPISKDATTPEVPEIEICPDGSTTLACLTAGDFIGQSQDSDFDGIEIPRVENTQTWQPEQLFASTGVCPNDVQAQTSFGALSFSYEAACGFAEKIRFLILMICTLISGFIIFRKG